VHSNLHIDLFVVLLMVAAGVSMTLKWIKLPYAIALVIVGLAIGVFHLLPVVEMTPDMVLLVFLPALLFEASWNLHVDQLKANWLPITLFATVGVVISLGLVAAVMHFGAGLALGSALLFGAMISATDPISVIALFRKMGIDSRLTMILEGESLFNDGTAVVLFNLILATITTSASVSGLNIVTNFLLMVVGGAAIGTTMGFLASKVTHFFDDHLLEITLTTILAYGSFLVADQLKVSPVISVITAGIVMGTYGSHSGMSATTRLAVNSFWEYAAFVVNSFVFLLIGLQVKFDLLIKYAVPICFGILAVLIARAVMVYTLSPMLSRKHAPISQPWRFLLFWGGLRGALCMALALTLPKEFVDKEQIIIVTFGVVLFTLLVPGLTIEPVARKLRMGVADENLDEYRIFKAELMGIAKAKDFLQKLIQSHTITNGTFKKLDEELDHKAAQLKQKIDDLHLQDSSIEKLELTTTKRRLLELRKDSLTTIAKEEGIDSQILQELRLKLDQEIIDLNRAHQ
jgi:monovalent cation:H+ antiporter, CPA1 family